MASQRTNVCKYCDKGFTSDRTLASHMCVRKKRWADRNLIGSQLGFRVFQEFYEISMNNKKPKTMDDFIRSKYYLQFVKFGRYMVELDPLYPDKFVRFVIENGVKLSDWQARYVYEKYLEESIKNEPVEKAIERTLLAMQAWGEENSTNFDRFFYDVDTNEAVFMIRSGKISPWVLYFSESGESLFSRLNLEQGKMLQEIINPSKWQVLFMRRQEDADFVRSFLENSNI